MKQHWTHMNLATLRKEHERLIESDKEHEEAFKSARAYWVECRKDLNTKTRDWEEACRQVKNKDGTIETLHNTCEEYENRLRAIPTYRFSWWLCFFMVIIPCTLLVAHLVGCFIAAYWLPVKLWWWV